LKTISAREFNQDVSRAKRAAEDGPLIITDRGKPAFVLLSHDDYLKLGNQSEPSLVDVLAEDDGIDFDPPKLSIGIRAASFD